MKGYWTCQRVTNGQKCRRLNQNLRRICEGCGKKRSLRAMPAHMSALDFDYAAYVKFNGGEYCGICGKVPISRRLDRDHDHKTGKPRGLLCWSCNRQLRTWATVEWLRSAAAYLERAA